MLHHISTRSKILVMIAVMSGLFLVALDQTIISTALAKIVQDFNSFSSLGFIVTAYLLTTTITVPLAGKLSDMFGRRKLLIIGVAVFSLGSLLSGISQNIDQLILFRALQGIGGGIITANAFTIVGDLFSLRERGKWQGIIGAVFGMASLVGPLLGGYLTDAHSFLGLTTDWRWTFFINVPIGIFALIVIARYCPSIKHDAKPKVDYWGATFITFALASLVLAVDNTDAVFKFLLDAGWTIGVIKTVLFVLAGIFAAAFCLIESKAKEPILPLRFFKNRTFTSVMFAALFFGAAFLGSILYLTQFNQQVFGANATTAGLMSLPMVGGMMVSSILIGRIVSKTGKYKRFMTAGFALATVSLLSLTILGPSSPYWHEAVIMVFIGLGLGMGMPIMNLAVQNEFEQKDLGAATASSQLFRGLGSTIGTAVFSGILTVGITANIGDIAHSDYIKTIEKSPQSSQLGLSQEAETIDTNVLLQLNAEHATIADQQKKAVEASPLPDGAKKQAIDDFSAESDTFRTSVIGAFSSSLHTIFLAAGGLMVLATLATLFVREKELGDSKIAPGISE